MISNFSTHHLFVHPQSSMQLKFSPCALIFQGKKKKKKSIASLLHPPSTITIKQLQQIHAQLLQLPSSSLPVPIFNSIILAYAAASSPSHAFAFFATQTHRPSLNEFTFQSLLKASSNSNSIAQVTQLHSLSFKLGFTNHTRIQNGFIRCYCVCGRLFTARKLFDEMTQRDTVSFNSMIHGYAESGDVSSACRLFELVPVPSPVTWTLMITMFSSAGNVALARHMFDEMPERDLVSWNSVISCYVRNQHPLVALDLFRRMLLEKLMPNRVTIASVLSACASVGALDAGKWIHVLISKKKFQLDPFLGSALVDMYSKCGAVEFALDVFGALREKNTCTWNAMINGLAMNGHSSKALDVFSEMQLESMVRPDEVTFVGVLLACSHGGFIDEGRRHFYFTTKKYGVELIVEHYACMVDLLGRCGHLKEAEELIKAMPIKPDIVVWRALLGGCRLHKNVELAERVVSEMEAHGSGDYVLQSNLYASVGRWKEVEKIRKIMKDNGIRKTPGCSSIEIGNVIHEFISGDKSHPNYEEISAKLLEMRKRMDQEGYNAETADVLYDIDEEEKEQALGHHSEKLAISFGLISTPPGSTLRVVKNLRFCADCHNVAKLISKIYNREIVVRDRVRFHHFKQGSCSCNEFW
ncbi:pentatricopeptide repeat-containing protein At5g48910-like [Typha latifolia]|uniref:pentatricopeptide repeat-containing protein At5g48910-like n=1 Tax=Typha latifolia TaxID=4733 RepID=UPI003C2D2378